MNVFITLGADLYYFNTFSELLELGNEKKNMTDESSFPSDVDSYHDSQNILNSSPKYDGQNFPFSVPTHENVTLPSNNSDDIPSEKDHFCKYVLYVEIGNSRVRIWDLFLLIPVLLFLLGLLLNLNNARLKLRASHSPIYTTFYGLIWMNTLIALVRCIVSMTVNAATLVGDDANILLYVSVRFFLLATEMSVIVFAIFFGHLDNKTSIQRVLIVTSVIALPYAIVQGCLELLSPDMDFYIESKDYNLFGHGGSLFWLVSSAIFAFVYTLILILRLNFLRKRFLFLLWLPVKKSFYLYLGFLAVLNAIQSVGSGLYHASINAGLCIVDITTWTYFSFLTPLIYYTFVHKFFRPKNEDPIENIVFSYKSEDEDASSLPPNNSDFPHSNIIFQTGSLPYSSLTEEEAGGVNEPEGGVTSASMNPLYSTSLQSPDSLTGYSLNSCDSITIAAYDPPQNV